MPGRDVDWRDAERPFSNRWFSVERKDGWHRIVQGPGAVAVPHVGAFGDPESLAVMVVTRRPAVGDDLLEFPRGGSSNDEGAVDAAVRETLEETGHVPAGRAPKVVGTLTPDAGILSLRVPVVAFEVQARPSWPTDGEALSVELVPWLDVPSRILRNGCCAISLAAHAIAQAAAAERRRPARHDLLIECIRSGQVPESEIAELMKDDLFARRWEKAAILRR